MPDPSPEGSDRTLRDVSTRSINRELLKARALLQELLGDTPDTVY